MYPPGRKQSRGRLADLMVPLESGNYPSTLAYPADIPLAYPADIPLAYPADIPLAYPVDILHMRNEQVSVSRFPIAYHLGDAIARLRPRMLVRAV
jgi:hypothetical protein